MQFTEAREHAERVRKAAGDGQAEYETASTKRWPRRMCRSSWTSNTLATLIYAQNFSMPAGYVQDASGESWLLKVGEEYDSVDDIAVPCCCMWTATATCACPMWRMWRSLITPPTAITRLNGEQAAVLKIYKNATSSASDGLGQLPERLQGAGKPSTTACTWWCCPTRATTSPSSSAASSPAWRWALHWPSSCWPSS